MAKKGKGASSKPIETKASEQPSAESQVNSGTPVAEESRESVPAATSESAATNISTTESTPVVGKKGSYDAVKAKAYRDKIKQAAIAGGHQFKERGVGTGITVKKLSKSGKTYYYQPWSQLNQEQKDSRLAAARTRNAEDRKMAAKYKADHPDLFPVKGGTSSDSATSN